MALCLILLVAGLALVSCKTNGDRILEQYDQQYPAIFHEFPDAQVCMKYADALTAMNRDLMAASDEMAEMHQNIARMWQQGHISERARNLQQQEYANSYLRYSNARVQNLRRQIGWSEAEFYYCDARVSMAGDPEYCSTLASALLNHLNEGLDLLGDYHIIGIEYCLEASDDFLRTL